MGIAEGVPRAFPGACKFHELEQGAIRIDGPDSRSVTQESLRDTIGMVTQDTSLLHRSIAANIG